MHIYMKKFGTFLNGRSEGREAALRLFQILGSEDKDGQDIVLDFEGVEIMTPSFADEMLRRANERYAGQKEIKIINTDTEVIRYVIKFVSEK